VTAGFEWYDSGIGFAIPFEDVLAALPRLKEGKDLEKGIVGVTFKGTDIYSAVPEVLQVNKNSPADKAGIKPGDQIIEIDGHPISRRAQIQHLLGVKYEGDRVALKFKRGKDVIDVKDLVLVSSLQVAAHPFLGILPLRDDPRLGVQIRHIFAKSPADKAGLVPGERIMKIGAQKALKPLSGIKSGRDELLDILNLIPAGNEITLEVKDKAGKVREVKVELDTLPGSLAGVDWQVPEKIAGPASFGKAKDPPEKSKESDDKAKLLKPREKADGDGKDDKAKDEKAKDEPAKEEKQKDDKAKTEPRKVETGFFTRATGDGEHKYWVYVPTKYNENVAHGVLVWLHPPGRNKEGDIREFVDDWEAICDEDNLIIVAPKSEHPEGWIASEADFIVGAVRDIAKIYTVDGQRIVAHGMGVGGQLALHLGMNHRDLFRGVITVGAVPAVLKDNQPQQRLAFYLTGGELDPLIKSIAEARVKLAAKRYSAVFREMPNRGREYLTEALIRDAARWIETLDKQ